MGMLTKSLKSINLIFTMGQSARLEEEKYTYQKKYEQYHALYKRVDTYKKEFDEVTLVIEKALSEVKSYLGKSERIIETSVQDKSELDINKENYTINKIDRLKDGLNASFNVGAGSILGGSVAVGSWGLVAALGSASTGAVISGLSGVAATNATLAWFGGGALAAGGAGKLGGAFVLFILFMVPIFFIATKLTLKKTKKYKEANEKLNNSIVRTLEQIDAFPEIINDIQTKKQEILKLCAKFTFDADICFKEIRPYGFFSIAKQKIRSLIGLSRYTSQQNEAIENLTQALTVFLTEIRVHLKA